MPVTGSIVIPTCQREDRVVPLCQALLPQMDTAPERWREIIVSDDRPSEAMKTKLEGLDRRIRYVDGPGRGAAANRNRGASCATGDWLVLLDDDVVPEEGLLAAYGRRLAGPDRALEGAVHPQGERPRGFWDCPINTTGGAFWTANVAVERALFDQIGGFDEGYRWLPPAFEDMDLHRRLQEVTKSTFVPEAKVYHPYRSSTFGEMVELHRRKTISFVYHARKHALLSQRPGWGELWQRSVTMYGRRACRHVRRGELSWVFLNLWLGWRFPFFYREAAAQLDREELSPKT